MEYSEYMSQMIAKIDRRAQLACARKEGKAEGREEVFSLLEQGLSLQEAKKRLLTHRV
jgi:hypothetical protein